MLIRLMSKSKHLIMPKGTEFTGLGKLGLLCVNSLFPFQFYRLWLNCHNICYLKDA